MKKTINSAKTDGDGNIVIQNADNSTITIHMDNPEEIRLFFINFQNQLYELPKKILELMESQNPNAIVTTGANIYLGLNTLISPEGTIYGIAFGVTITNLTKENRFFNTPFFKLSVPFDGQNDAFVLINTIEDPVKFPKKLEYGEVVSQTYKILKDSKEIFEKTYKNDPNATIQVIASTTIGEIYKSKGYSIAMLLDNFKYAIY